MLISDIGLPDGTGYELMERLRFARPSFTGRDRPERLRNAFGQGPARPALLSNLVKPVTLDSLQSAIQGSQPKPKVPKRGNMAPKPVIGEKNTTHLPPGKPTNGKRNSL